ncbi:MAG TPA: glycosyltransferase family 39 protein, partial [Acidobacteriaceae bacterium]|nr:glycosyltransferase family 39 protein [Acidobacteriaceae bacterium]
MMQGLARYRPYALLCAVLLLVCILASHPVAETGINDDFSYVKSAQLMSTTGHMAYVGWASAMEGWLIPLGALFIKLFGFSFTGVRAAGVLVATVTAVLMQRSCVRSGLSERNAAIATLAIVLSPLYLPLASTYMTDIPGLLVVVLCYYGCLRAVESATGHGATAWLTAICVLTAIGGTARQTGWLG